MHIIDTKRMSQVFNSMALHFTLIIGLGIVVGLVVKFVAPKILFWLPSKARIQVSTSLAGLGLLYGLWLGVKFILH